MSHYHGSKRSGSQQSFLTETEEKNVLPLCSSVQSCTGHTCRYFRVFFFAIRQDHGLLRSWILLPWQRDVTTLIRLAY